MHEEYVELFRELFQGEEKETLAYKILPADTTKTLSEIEDVDELQL